MADSSTRFDSKNSLAALSRLERRGLDDPTLLTNATRSLFDPQRLWTAADLQLHQVRAVIRSTERADELNRELVGLLGMLWASAAPFIFVAAFHEGRLNIIFGSVGPTLSVGSLHAAIESSFPFVEITSPSAADVQARLTPFSACAILTGAPSGPHVDLVGRLARGLAGTPGACVVVAVPVSSYDIVAVRAGLFEEIVAGTPFLKMNQAVVQRSRETVTVEHSNPSLERYIQGLQRYLQEIAASADAGMWRVSLTLAAKDAIGLARLRALSCGAWSNGAGEPALVEPLRVLAAPESLRKTACELRPHAPLQLDEAAAGLPILAPFFGGVVTPMAGSRLAAICAVPSEEFPGFAVSGRSRFKVDPPKPPPHGIHLGEILEIARPTGLACEVPRDDLCKHALVAGVTGSGKTTTCMSLLLQLNQGEPRIPFLVIEPAKREYRRLLAYRQMQDLVVFTVGDETTAPMRLNPFEVPPGASVAMHLDLLRAAFQAAFPMYPPMPQVLERCLHEIYADHGWDLVRGERRGGLGTPDDFPTLTDLFNKIDSVVEAMEYDVRITKDVKAAMQARIGSLRLGGKGTLLDCWRSTPLDQLLDRPVVLELEGIADDEEKAFVLGLLLTRLYEHRVASHSGKRSQVLRHVTLFEEAHRLLARTPDQGGNPDAVNTKAKAVETFSNILSEIRAYGEAIIVAEQIPAKLAADVIKNTSLKIAHRLVAADDRELIGTSMKMSSQQREDLAVLSAGAAVAFSEGFDGPYLLRVRPPEAPPSLAQDAVHRAHSRWRANHDASFGKYATCRGCPAKCLNSNTARDLRMRPSINRAMEAFFATLTIDPEALNEMYQHLRRRFDEAEPALAADPHLRDDVLICALIELGEQRLTRSYDPIDPPRRDAQLLERYGQFTTALFRDRGRAMLRRQTITAASHFAEHSRSVRHQALGPFPGCKEACRYRCVVRPVGELLASHPSLAHEATRVYAQDRVDRFSRVRNLLRTRTRSITEAPESTLDALATCTFIHLLARADLDEDDARWAVTQFAQA